MEMLLTLDTSINCSASDSVFSRPQAAGWINAQTWMVDRRKRGKSTPLTYSSEYSKYSPVAAMDDRPPPVPPKDRRRSPTASTKQITRRKVPAPLQPAVSPSQHEESQQGYLTVRGQHGASYTSYTYPPGAQIPPPGSTSAPSTRTEFADVNTSSPSWQRPTELFLPQDEVTQLAAAFEQMVSPVESPRTATSLRRTVSSYTAADYSPSVYTPSVHSPPSTADISRAATLRSQNTWVGPSPISPSVAREHWAQNSYPPARSEQRQATAWTPSEEPFEDASQFHLFAEATAGLGPLVDHNDITKQQRNILSPVATRAQPTSSQNPTYLTHATHEPRAVSVPPHIPQEYYAPRVVPAVQRRQTYVQGRPREAQQLSEAFAEALTGFGPEGEVGPDDELPDYAQSQREAQQRQRRAAAQRAQELEQRWATARKAAQSRGR